MLAVRGRSRDLFTTVETEGGVLPADLLQRVVARDPELNGLTEPAYHLAKGETFGEATSRSWNRLVGAWAAFRVMREKLPVGDAGTGVTRERWLLPLFQEVGFGRLPGARARELGGKSYPISHFWGDRVPIHLVGCGVDLDKRTVGVAGAARTSPHSLVQEYLNRTDESLWGVVSNGLSLRLLRDNASLTRQAYVQFDLEAMFEGEAYADFALLWLLCHESRFEGESPAHCWLEQWSQLAQAEGTRALETLREGVEQAISILGQGFLAHPANRGLRESLRSGELSRDDYFRQLLRLVYRLIFLFVAEDRSLLLAARPGSKEWERYARYYSTVALRQLAGRRRGTAHPDLFRTLRVVMDRLGSDEGYPELGLPALGSFLWSQKALPDLAHGELRNHDLLDGVRALSFDTRGGARRPVDFKNLGAEELGSVYESLLELHPELHAEAAKFELKTAPGHERKTTGSYYTPESLVQCLLDSALEPVLAEAARSRDPERSILALKVCDPACGSGHFLIAAAHRIAKRLAALRTGDEEPSPEAIRKALRDVIGHCLYGVDVNPMAVELCKVGLWLDALEPGKPLSFLEHKIRCGNSLLGTTPALLAEGIRDDAFAPIQGDDPDVARELRNRNREERRGQTTLLMVTEAQTPYLGLADRVGALEALPDDSIGGVHEKEEQFRRLLESTEYEQVKLLADAWCAAFVWPKTKGASPPVTQDVLRQFKDNPQAIPAVVRSQVDHLAADFQFFHWHLAFPDVFQPPLRTGIATPALAPSGGFDVVLGNPPWEKVQLQEQEFFAVARPDVAQASGSRRKKLIEALRTEDQHLYQLWMQHKRLAEGLAALIRSAGRFPLSGRGKLNTYSLFLELSWRILGRRGRAGLIVQSGLVTDESNQALFTRLVAEGALVSAYDFENSEGLFPAVHREQRFCLATIESSPTGTFTAANERPVRFAFWLTKPDDLHDPDRAFTLTMTDLKRMSPNTGACPTFRTMREASIIRGIYERTGVMCDETDPGPAWSIVPTQLINMTSDSSEFMPVPTAFADAVPVYEAKLTSAYDHRYATFVGAGEGAQLRTVSLEEHQRPEFVVQPRYWMRRDRLHQHMAPTRWHREWFLTFHDIANPNNERTCLFSVVPYSAVGNSAPIIVGELEPEQCCVLCALGNSFAFDFVGRRRIVSRHLNFFLLKQLPAPLPEAFARRAPWTDSSVGKWISRRILELSYTSWDLEPFARDLGYVGPPFKWDEHRRFMIMCELDAAMFHLYGVQREDVEHILDTFPLVRDRDVGVHHEYRTKRMILDIYDRLRAAIESGRPYNTLLDPRPGDPRAAHVAPERRRAVAGSKVIAFRRVRPRREERYETCVPMLTLKAAAGAFGDEQAPEFETWVMVPTSRRLQKGMFVAQVKGRSMEPTIPSEAFCLFKYPVLGSRQKKVVLVEHRGIEDPETGGTYAVKRYVSEKAMDEDGSWRHVRVRLVPENAEFPEIVLDEEDEGQVRVIAEFLDVISRGPPEDGE